MAVTDQAVTTREAAHTADGDLHRSVLPWWAMYATSVGSVAPTAGLAIAIAGVSLSAGNATWLTWLIVTVGIGGIGYCISRLARAYATSGGLYGMGALVGGSVGGYLQGSAQLLALLIALPALAIGIGIYFVSFLGKLGVGGSHALNIACYAIGVLAVLYVALADVRVSARLLLLLELASVALIVVLFAIVLVKHHGGILDHAQLSLKGITAHNLFLALAFATYCLAGFENAATLGRESTNPRRDIPRAVVGTVVVIGALYVLASYVEVLGLPDGKLGASAAPLNDLADVGGVGWFSWIIDICITVSFFTCLLAASNTTARVLFTLGRDGVIPRAFGRASATHNEPWFALVVILTYAAVVAAIFGLTSTTPLEAYAYIGTLSGYMFIGVYLVVLFLAVRHAVRTHELDAAIVVAALLGTATMFVAAYFSWVPLPTGPYHTIFLIFVGLVAVVLLGLLAAVKLQPAWWREVGTSLQEGAS